MSKLVRLPLSLLAVLAALLFLPGIAWGDTTPPSPEECASATPPDGCPAPSVGDVVDGTVPGDPATEPPSGPAKQAADENSPPPQNQQSAPLGAGTAPQLAVEDPAPAPPDLCTTFPQAPLCAGPNPPTVPLTCDGLAQLLGQTQGCPSSFTCADLADLLDITCPAGPPDCQALAELFHLEGCPQPPTNCQEFADLLGVDHCSDIPCIDTSQLPPQARDGLKPLLDGLKNIGIKECPVTPVGSTPPPGKGTYMPNPPAAQQPSQPYYANCTDAHAQGASNIPAGAPGYRPELDSDHDGIACEADTPQAVATTPQPTGTLAYTGLELGPQLNVAWTLLVLGTGLLIIGRRRA